MLLGYANTFKFIYTKVNIVVLIPFHLMHLLVFCPLLLNTLFFGIDSIFVPKSLSNAINHDVWRQTIEEEMRLMIKMTLENWFLLL